MRTLFQEFAHRKLCIQATRCKPFQGLPHGTGNRFINDQLLTATLGIDIFVADRRTEYPKALFNTGFHLLDDLAAILFSFQFALGGNNRFNKLAFRRIFKIEVQTFTLGIPLRHFASEF
ncbi:hypothetical protein [Roseibium sp. TrichSKD4]|uniref:hypothetical protein n=1 Tax=Roseibium sp. TrichSKD4 TaxID=744980 RepID=UPI00058AF96B|nr:hypothetical protein [Roseibium sp. TrichSKD4]